MIRTLPLAFVAVLMACNVNYYDQSTHHSSSGGTGEPDTVYIEPESPRHAPFPPDLQIQPDTTRSRRLLVDGGVVEISSCGNWTRHELRGCVSETDGAALEIRPVVTYWKDTGGNLSKTYELVFGCRLQSWLADSEPEVIEISALPVVTGTEVVSIVAGNTTFPFLDEESSEYASDWLPDGTLSYTAVFPAPAWKMKEILTADEIIARSESPDFRLIFADDSRILFQQFHDIFIVHDGDAPILPVTAAAPAVSN